MKVGSLFSGVGGIEIGFEKQGFETKWFIENEPYAQTILKKRFPSATVYEDITKLDFETIPKVDVLTGGFPCQDISNAGKRDGIEGSRSSLWKYFLKAISTLRPRYALIENVSALIGRGLDVVLCDLAKVGYDAEWHCVSASSVGAIHKRDRIFIIAYPNLDRKSDGSFYEVKGQGVMDAPNTNGNRKKRREQRGSVEVCEDVSDSNGKRRKGGREEQIRYSELSEDNVENTLSIGVDERNREEIDRGKERSEYTSESKRTGWWAVEPKLGRVADGISSRVDRIRCIGNAVVPQVAQVFAEAIRMTELTLLTGVKG